MVEFDPDRVPLRGERLVEAGAGTGKTWTLVRLHRRLLLEKKIPIDRILVVTFTNAATAEVKTRIREELRRLLDAGEGEEDLLRRALRDFDRAPVSTIHGFCGRVLQEEAFQSGTPFDVPLTGEAAAGTAEKTRDFWVEKTYYDADGKILGVAPGPKALAGIAREVRNRPDLVSLPRMISGETLRAWKRVEERFEEARRAWKEGKDEAVGILTGGGLKGSAYQSRWISSWVEKLETFLEEGNRFYLLRKPIKREANWARKLDPSEIERNRKGTAPLHRAPFFQAWGRLIEACNNPHLTRLQPEQLEFLLEFVERIRSRPEDPAVLLREGFTFDDMLFFVKRALEGPRGEDLARALRERYRAVLVDEFQDTDPVQYWIFRRVFGGTGTPLFFVGDPKQAIYSFRGGDVFTYRAAREETGGEPLTLVRNWRSDPSLVEAWNSLFGRKEAPFGFDWIPYREARAQEERDRLYLEGRPASGLYLLSLPGGRRVLSKENASREAAAAGAAWLASFLEKRPVVKEEGGERVLGPGDTAVLVRTNRQASLVARALSRAGLPAVLLGTASVFDTVEAEEVERLLRALVEPTRKRTLTAALATGIFGRRAGDLSRFAGDARAWEREVERFTRWRKEAGRRGFLAVFLEILGQEDVLDSVLGERRGERRLTNLRHLGELLDRASRERRLGLHGLAGWLGRMRRDWSFREEVGSEGEQIRLETDEAAVKVSTVHRSKGLEYPVALCPFTWDEPGGQRYQALRAALFHEREKPFRTFLDLGSARFEESEERAAEEKAAEARRLFYVALTRAKHLAAMALGPFRGLEESTPGILLGVEKEDLKGPGLEEKLASFAAGSRGRVVVEALQPGERKGPPPEEGEAPPLEGRSAERVLEAWGRISSFSGLVAGEGLSFQAGPDLPGNEPGEGETPGPALWASPPEPVTLHHFPAGAEAGNLFHRILEKVDFRDREGWEEAVARTLGEQGFGPEWKEKVLQALGEIVETPLFAGGPALEAIPRERRLSEMEFLFPCGRGEERVTAARLSRAFAGEGGRALPEGYAERIAGLDFGPLRGFLRGFVDLVFQWEGKWWLADYKTNHLGPSPGDYGPESLASAMEEHHYFLQYHIYTAALHLYLERRLDEYDYERDFGGVFYLFLRGMGGKEAGPRGIFRDRPTRERTAAILEALGGPGRRGGES